jgi:putative hydrolase of the HAD superfamily
VPSLVPVSSTSDTRTIQAVLFDYGGVFTPSPFAAARAYAHAQNTDPDVLMGLVFGPYDRDTDHPWHQLERGELDLVGAMARIAADAEATGVPFELRELFSGMADDGIDRTVVVDFVRTLRPRGIRTAVVTNNIREYGNHWREQLGADELFDVIVDSCEEGVRKPNPVIYETALARVGVDDPSRAVFLDDFEHNVITARNLGMHGILVEPDPRPALAAVSALLDG